MFPVKHRLFIALGIKMEAKGMKQSELNEIESLLENVISAPIKAEIKQPLKRLNFIKSTISATYGRNAAYKLSEAIGSAESAAGRSPDKEHHRLRCKMHWSTFNKILSNLRAIE